VAVAIREYRRADLDTILDIAVAAWQPVFESSRTIVGSDLFETVHGDPDGRKRKQVTLACQADNPTLVWIAETDGDIAGFITVTMNNDSLVAEIGNNAVSPAHQHQGIGTKMYDFVLDQMKQAGMKAAVVTTGGDDAHAPARRAYEKAGFSGPVPSVEYHIKL
jgi:ribosomal protein S18 acetylase RimI-like enzyme